MIRYRPFRNTDPPALAEIWQSQPPQRGLMQPMSAALLEQLVFCKPYFDRQGLLVAVDGERPVGFVHAGFGPTDDFATLSTQRGVTCLLQVTAHAKQAAIAEELLAQSEEYLRRHGAQQLYGGGIHPLNPFYLGLYGGSELPGVLQSDTSMVGLYQKAGYRQVDRCLVLQRSLERFRPLIDRQQMQVRRNYRIEVLVDPPAANWWEACTLAMTNHTRFELLPKQGGTPCAQATFWDIEPLASSWGVAARGLLQLEVAPTLRRQGLATFLVGEALRRFRAQGITRIEAQTMDDNRPAVNFYQKLGFHQVDQGLVFCKEEAG